MKQKLTQNVSDSASSLSNDELIALLEELDDSQTSADMDVCKRSEADRLISRTETAAAVEKTDNLISSILCLDAGGNWDLSLAYIKMANLHIYSMLDCRILDHAFATQDIELQDLNDLNMQLAKTQILLTECGKRLDKAIAERNKSLAKQNEMDK